MAKTSNTTVNKRLLKSGHGLYVAIPSEVIEQWGLDKGDEVTVNVAEGTMKIQPNQPTKFENFTEESIAAYSKAMQGVEARVTVDPNACAIHLEFSGQDRKIVDMFVRNLWQNLPPFLRMLGLGSVEEHSEAEENETG
ncbi:MAG: AbrB/MazE/SpoVT family DNA-binding domain-containing protein [Dehalococcoidia bacterium]